MHGSIRNTIYELKKVKSRYKHTRCGDHIFIWKCCIMLKGSEKENMLIKAKQVTYSFILLSKY